MDSGNDVSDGLVGAIDRVLLDGTFDVSDRRLDEPYEIGRTRAPEHH